MSSTAEQRLNEAAELISSADSIFFITGAGISADSGLPTYRGVGGLYDGRQTVDGVSIEAALSAGMFRSRPEITWKYMGEIEASARSKTFNRGHEVIAELERNKPRVWVLTQNIDGYHLAAGSRNVIEIHGTMRRIRCTQCGKTKEVQTYEGLQIPPHCESCSGLIRPDVVLFDEMLPEKATQTLERELRQGFELYVSIGTSSVFPYIIQPILYAQMVGLPTIEINPANKTDISKLVTVHVPIRAAEALDRIAQKIGL
jgi:NAD-dependent deacetylase